jgi:hypothetical protein
MKLLYLTRFTNDDRAGPEDARLSALAEDILPLGLEVAVAGTEDGKLYQLSRAGEDSGRGPMGRDRIGRCPVFRFVAAFEPRAAAASELVLSYYLPDVVHTGDIEVLGPFGWQALRRWGARVLHELDNEDSLCAFSGRAERAFDCGAQCTGCRLATRRRRLASAEVDAVVCDEDRLLNRYLGAGYFPAARWSEVIPKGHDREARAKAYLKLYEKIAVRTVEDIAVRNWAQATVVA